jgi:hypothetical protein
MRLYFSFFALAFTITSFGQQKFGLLKFKTPGLWQQQTRSDFESYSAPDPNAEGVYEIIFYTPQEGAAKIDSSFKTEWKRLVTQANVSNPIPAGLRYAENGAEVKQGNSTAYMQLLVFAINDKIQSVALIAKDLASFRRSREQVFDFMESIDSVVKIEQ